MAGVLDDIDSLFSAPSDRDLERERRKRVPRRWEPAASPPALGLPTTDDIAGPGLEPGGEWNPPESDPRRPVEEQLDAPPPPRAPVVRSVGAAPAVAPTPFGAPERLTPPPGARPAPVAPRPAEGNPAEFGTQAWAQREYQRAQQLDAVRRQDFEEAIQNSARSDRGRARMRLRYAGADPGGGEATERVGTLLAQVRQMRDAEVDRRARLLQTRRGERVEETEALEYERLGRMRDVSSAESERARAAAQARIDGLRAANPDNPEIVSYLEEFEAALPSLSAADLAADGGSPDIEALRNDLGTLNRQMNVRRGAAGGGTSRSTPGGGYQPSAEQLQAAAEDPRVRRAAETAGVDPVEMADIVLRAPRRERERILTQGVTQAMTTTQSEQRGEAGAARTGERELRAARQKYYEESLDRGLDAAIGTRRNPGWLPRLDRMVSTASDDVIRSAVAQTLGLPSDAPVSDASRGLAQMMQDVQNAQLRDMSGAAVSEQEFARFRRAVGATPTGLMNSPRAIRQWVAALRARTMATREGLRAAYRYNEWAGRQGEGGGDGGN